MHPAENQDVPPSLEVPTTDYWRRVAWIGVKLILVYCFVDEFRPFFYQAF